MRPRKLVLAWRIHATKMMRGASRVNIGMWLHQSDAMIKFFEVSHKRIIALTRAQECNRAMGFGKSKKN